MASMPPNRKKPFPDVRAVGSPPPTAPSSATMSVATTPQRSAAPSEEEIARAAYLRWQRLGGDPVSNWLAAEAELRAAARIAK